MVKIQVGGAGGAPSNNFIRSLRQSKRKDYLIGTSCVPSDLFLADTDEKYVVPPANEDYYIPTLLRLLKKTQPDLIHVQNDYEILAVSRAREPIQSMGPKLFLPALETVENCVNKEKSYQIWKKAGMKVPESMRVNSSDDLYLAFKKWGPKIWIRLDTGAAGRGALSTDNTDFAKHWIDHFNGWGQFVAAECLTAESVTWLSIWFEGELVVAQTRRRKKWGFANRTLTGITGITEVAETCSDPVIDGVARQAIMSIDTKPHGIFGVDMTIDHQGFPNPTEINIGRFFTTHFFFTKAGLNMPEIYCDIVLENKFPKLHRKINPLPDGLVWIRGMDVEPVLTTTDALEKMEKSRV